MEGIMHKSFLETTLDEYEVKPEIKNGEHWIRRENKRYWHNGLECYMDNWVETHVPERGKDSLDVRYKKAYGDYETGRLLIKLLPRVKAESKSKQMPPWL